MKDTYYLHANTLLESINDLIKERREVDCPEGLDKDIDKVMKMEYIIALLDLRDIIREGVVGDVIEGKLIHCVENVESV